MSGPDSGLALAILLAMTCMVLGPAVVGGGVGFFVARIGARRRGDEKKGVLMTLSLTLGGLLVGGGIGAVAILFTFFESIFDPVLVFDVPPGFSRDEVFVIEDPAASGTLEVGLFSREATLEVPPSGVGRVRSHGDFAGGPLNARLASGATSMGASAMMLPDGRPILCFTFRPWSPDDLSCEREGRALVDHLEALEGAR